LYARITRLVAFHCPVVRGRDKGRPGKIWKLNRKRSKDLTADQNSKTKTRYRVSHLWQN
jgi:ribosomal protein L24